MLSQEQTERVKKQLIEQIEKVFPEDRKEFAKKQIEEMNSEQLEEFLIKNKLVSKENKPETQCVFCSIVFGDISSYKIAENSKAIAVLEINPVSEGHVLVIPKEHITKEKDLPEQVLELAKGVSDILKKRLKAKNVKISSSNVMGHEVLNLVPIYENKEISERKSASPDELKVLSEFLNKKTIKKTKRTTNQKVIKSKNKKIEKIWLPKRIP